MIDAIKCSRLTVRSRFPLWAPSWGLRAAQSSCRPLACSGESWPSQDDLYVSPHFHLGPSASLCHCGLVSLVSSASFALASTLLVLYAVRKTGPFHKLTSLFGPTRQRRADICQTLCMPSCFSTNGTSTLGICFRTVRVRSREP